MFVHELPTTGAVSFADFVLSTRYSTEVARTTQYRAQLRETLKQNRKSVADEQLQLAQGDWLKIVQAIDDYLPHLFSLFECVQSDDILLRSEPEFSWRTTLSSYLFKSSPRITLKGIHYEVAAVLLLYGCALSNFAAAAVASLGNYELDKTLLEADRKKKDDTIKWAADTFCKAAGIFEYLSEKFLPLWEAQAGRAIDGRPPDLTKEVTIALSKMALADAQLLSIRKLLSSAVAEANDFNTPGPPLPSGHPSPSLLAKLYLNVTSLYSNAAALSSTVSKKSTPSNDFPGADAHSEVTAAKQSSKTSSKLIGKLKGVTSTDSPSANSTREVDVALLNYLSASASVSKAIAHKWLAIDAGENGNRVGEAVAFLKVAEASITVKKERFSFIGSNKPRDSRAELKTIQEQEAKNISQWLKAYIKLNDTVAFQPVPSASDLTSKIPAGRAVLAVKPYFPPQSLFGPKAPGYEPPSEQAPDLHRHIADLSLQQKDGTKDTQSKYAGANAYY